MLGRMKDEMSTRKKSAVKKSETVSRKMPLFDEVAQIIAHTQQSVVRTVNTHMVLAYWLIGWRIVEAEQGGKKRAESGTGMIEDLASRLKEKFGKGYSPANLKNFREFYLVYADRLPQIRYPAGSEFELARVFQSKGRGVPALESSAAATEAGASPIRYPAGSEFNPAEPAFHPNLSWSHYRALMRVKKPLAREFYEGECIQCCWTKLELERQISSLYYERLLMSKNRKKMILENRKPALTAHAAAALEVIKDPYVLEFLGLPEHRTLNETDLEAKLVGQLQAFLMELGQGFAFIGRQQRLTLEGDHFYADLVFYHAKLKCYVVIDLKTQKLTHADLGQMQLYVNYYDEEIAAQDDNPTLGLILCTDKNEAVCKYVLGKGNQSIFTSRYQLHLPTEEQLAAELRRELAVIQGGKA